MKNRNLVLLGVLGVCLIAVYIFLISPMQKTRRAETEIQEMDVRINTVRTQMQSHFQDRARFLEQHFSLPNPKSPEIIKTLQRIQALQLSSSLDFELYDQLQAKASSYFAEAITKAFANPKLDQKLVRAAVAELERIDRDCETMRKEYVEIAFKRNQIYSKWSNLPFKKLQPPPTEAPVFKAELLLLNQQ